MSRKRRTHLRGKRGRVFADKIRDIPLDRILCVSIDVHKYFHVVMIHNALEAMLSACSLWAHCPNDGHSPLDSDLLDMSTSDRHHLPI